MQIRFNYETKYGVFSDALNLEDDHGYTEAELETMKEARRDSWVAYIDSTQVSEVQEQLTLPLDNPQTEPGV
jgi:hypothetical protein